VQVLHHEVYEGVDVYLHNVSLKIN